MWALLFSFSLNKNKLNYHRIIGIFLCFCLCCFIYSIKTISIVVAHANIVISSKKATQLIVSQNQLNAIHAKIPSISTSDFFSIDEISRIWIDWLAA